MCMVKFVQEHPKKFFKKLEGLLNEKKNVFFLSLETKRKMSSYSSKSDTSVFLNCNNYEENVTFKCLRKSRKNFEIMFENVLILILKKFAIIYSQLISFYKDKKHAPHIRGKHFHLSSLQACSKISKGQLTSSFYNSPFALIFHTKLQFESYSEILLLCYLRIHAKLKTLGQPCLVESNHIGERAKEEEKN